MSNLEIKVPCSPEQEDVIADHLLFGGELGILPDERAWIKNHVQKRHPEGRVVTAQLDLENAQWIVEVSDK